MMNFRAERESRKWTLQEVAEKTGYSVAAINGLEKRNKGGYELRVILNRLYGNPEPVPYHELRDRTPVAEGGDDDLRKDRDFWRDRANKAEARSAYMEHMMVSTAKGPTPEGWEGPRDGEAVSSERDAVSTKLLKKAAASARNPGTK